MINDDHKILCGDCINEMKKLEAGSVNLIITDPPYNVGLKYVKKYFNDSKRLPEYLDWIKMRLTECERVLDKNGTMYLMNYPELNARLLPFLEDELKLKLRRWIVWNYPTNIGHHPTNWTRSHRSILFLVKGKNYTFNRQPMLQHYKNPESKKIKERVANGSTGRNAYDVLRFLDLIEMQPGLIDVIEMNLCKNVTTTRIKGHPCQLPFPLIELFIKVSSNPGDIVMDPFAGTFSVSEIAKKLSRRSIGIDIARSYCNIGIRRLNSANEMVRPYIQNSATDIQRVKALGV